MGSPCRKHFKPLIKLRGWGVRYFILYRIVSRILILTTWSILLNVIEGCW